MTRAVTSAYHYTSSYVSHYASYYASKAWSGIKAVGSFIASTAKSVYRTAKNAVSSLVKTGIGLVKKGLSYAKQKLEWAKQKAAEVRRAAVAKAKAITAAAKKAVTYAIKHTPLRVVAAAAKPLLHGLAKVVSAAASLPAKVVSTVRDVVKDTAKAVQVLYDKTVEAAGTVVRAVSAASQVVTEFVADHAAAIVGGVAGLAVGLGCGALIGWTGVGAVACGALGGAVGSFITGYMNGERGWSLAGTTLMGAAFGGLTGGLFSVGGAALSGAFRGAAGTGLRGLAGARQAAGQELDSILGGRVTGGLLRRPAACNSFAASTAVLMADGSHKLISQVKVGDQVLTTDPTTGRTAPHEVTDVIVGTGEKQLVEVSVADGKAKRATITATDEHPFWVDSENRWVYAKDLKPGYQFETVDHRPATVAGTRTWTEHQRVYNLTVDTTHTYYVVAGDTPVLVHNCGTLDWSKAKIQTNGVDAVEKHLLRFADGVPLEAAEQGMLNRLRAISAGDMTPTPQDLKFYTHELRESVLYRKAGYPTGQPETDSYELWDKLHTRALEDYGLTRAGAPDDLYHPSVR